MAVSAKNQSLGGKSSFGCIRRVVFESNLSVSLGLVCTGSFSCETVQLPGCSSSSMSFHAFMKARHRPAYFHIGFFDTNNLR
jgi:hypothetical protein